MPMRSSTSGSRRLRVGLLAVLLAAIPPLLGYLSLPPTREGSALPVVERTLMLRVPELSQLVLLGNSKAGTDIVPADVRAGAGAPKLRMQVVSIGSATLPVYYAVVKNVVLAQAHPSVIVIYATPVEILASDLTADRREYLLHPYLTSDEPVIARKLYNHAPGGLLGLRERAVTARDGTLSLLAETAATAVTGESGRSALDTAFADVFGQTWATRTRPDASAVRAGAYPSESALAQVIEDSFVMELEALCHEHGARLVFAVAPVSGIIKERERARLRGMEPVLADAKKHADAWIDLPYPGDDPANWRDGEHLNPGAARATSRALGEGLKAVGVL